jgi:hypothetical protein
MRITIVEAVKAGYSTKPTIYRDIKKGNITATRNKKGANVIDVADLVTLYGEPSKKPAAKSTKEPPASVTALKAELEAVKAELDRARHEADHARRAVEDERIGAKEERERLYSMVETGQKQLEDLSQRDRPGLIKRIFG